MAILAVYKSVHDYRLFGHLSEQGLLSILVRDSVVYFFLCVHNSSTPSGAP